MATIEQRGAESWAVYWRSCGRTGKQQCTFRGKTGKRLAERAKRLVEAHDHKIDRTAVYATVLKLPPITPAPKADALPTVREWADTWLASRTRISPGTRGRYRAQLDNEILPRIGHLHLDEVDGTAVAKLLTELRDGRLDTTVTRYYAVVHSLFEFAVVDKRLGDNPARRTDFVRDLVAFDDAGEDEHVYLTAQEFGVLFSAAPERAKPLLRTLVDTGARWGEATALNVRDLDLFAKPSPTIRITKAWKQDEAGKWYRGSTKGRERRTVPIPQRTVDALLPLVADRQPDSLLFRAPQGGRLVHSNWRTRYWLPTLAAAGRCPAHPPAGEARPTLAEALAGPRCGDNGGRRSNGRACGALVHPGWDRCKGHLDVPLLATSACDCPTRMARGEFGIHQLRHTHVSWLVAAGRPLVAISRRIGHHSTTITERTYAGILPEVDDATVAALDALTDQEVAQVAPDLCAAPVADDPQPALDRLPL